MQTKMLTYFEEVKTEKPHRGYSYSVKDTITIAILGSICGLKNISQIHQWATNERIRTFLKEKYSIEKVPCYYWMLCLMKIIKPASLNECSQRWTQSLLPEETKDLTIAMDGKMVCSTKNPYSQAFARSSRKKSSDTALKSLEKRQLSGDFSPCLMRFFLENPITLTCEYRFLEHEQL